MTLGGTCAGRRRAGIGPELAHLIDVCLGGATGFPNYADDRQRNLDWQRLYDLAVRHRVEGLLAVHFETTAATPSIPDFFRCRLEDRRKDLAVTFLQQTAELVRLVRLLSKAGIETIVLKGAPLAAKLYAPIPEVRQSIDIDLLVDPSVFAEAEAVLRRDGYRRETPSASIPQSADAMARHLLNAYELIEPVQGFKVELHHRPLQDQNSFRVPFEQLRARSEVAAFGGEAIHCLGAADLPAYLCAHAASHQFFRLKWLADLTRLFDGLGEQGTADVLAGARALGVHRHVVLSLAMIESLTGRRYHVLCDADRRRIAGLRKWVMASILAVERGASRFSMKDVPADLGEMIYGMLLADNYRSRSFKLLQHLSNHQDLSTLGLGARWSPVYAVLGRPLALWRWIDRSRRSEERPHDPAGSRPQAR